MGTQRRRPHSAVIAALAAGLLIRLWFVRHAPVVTGDSLVYGGIAKNWMLRGVYGFYDDAAGGVSPTLIRLPGYPMFLVACFRLFGMEHYGAVRYVQAIADLLTCWLAAATARRIFGERAAVAALWVAALCPFTANYSAAVLTETLVLFMMTVAFYATIRWRSAGAGWNGWLWVTAGALGYSLLLRPEQVLLAVAVLPAMAWIAVRERRGILPVVWCAVCVGLVLVPWTLRNWRTFHVFQPLAPRYANDPGEASPLGFARWFRTWAIEFASTDEVYWNYNGDQIDPAMLPARAFDAGSAEATAALRARTIGVLDQYNLKAQQTAESERGFAELARERIRAHPVEYYGMLPVARLLDMMLRPRTEMTAVPLEWWHWRESPARSALAALYATVNLLYLALGAAGWWCWRRMRPVRAPAVAWAMAATVLLRCALLLTIDNSEPRYTLEFFPIVFVCAGALFEAAWRRSAAATSADLAGTAAARNG